MRDRKKRGRGRKQGKEFMDAALDAYKRHLALHKWRQVMDVQASVNIAPEQAVREAGRFPGLGSYQDVWERWWDAQVVATAVSRGAVIRAHRGSCGWGAQRGDHRPGGSAVTRRLRIVCPTRCLWIRR